MVQQSTPTRRNAVYSLTLAGLIGMAVFGWSHIAPAGAQDDPANQVPRQGGGRPGGFGGGMGGFGGPMMGGGAAITANGDYVYILRGSTVYQMRASNLSLVGQKNLPAPAGGGFGGGGGGFGGPPPPGQPGGQGGNP